MSNIHTRLPVGMFDSGVGGVSVLARAISHLPKEQFIYYADSRHAPYGVKSLAEVRELSENAVRFLCSRGIKALVVACNTATSVAISEIRGHLDIPVIGMEPAVKPAVELAGAGKIVVMATPLTLSQKKFSLLLHRFEEQADIVPLPCPGLVELIEAGRTKGEEVGAYLRELMAPLDLAGLSAVVLGCTHYVFIKDEVQKVVGPRTAVIDGNCGTVKNLARILAREGLLFEEGTDTGLDAAESESRTNAVRMPGSRASVSFYTSGDEAAVIPLCQRLLNEALTAVSCPAPFSPR